jgi:hypothetical protein
MRFQALAFLLPLALATPTPKSTLAPLSKSGETIDDSYIVVFKKDVNPSQIALHIAGVEGAHESDVSAVQIAGHHTFLPSLSMSERVLHLLAFPASRDPVSTSMYLS